MTDITDQDRRDMLEWANDAITQGDASSPRARTVAHYVRATVDAPAPTLAEELRDVADSYGMSSRAADRVNDIADRVEHALAEACAEVDGKPVQKGAESNAETTNPADVPAGEAWLVEVDGERRPAVKDKEDPIPWNTVSTNGVLHPEYNGNVTLLHRLVPAPRVITNPDDLDALAEGTIVRDKDGDAWRRTCDEWTTTADYGRFTSWAVSRSGPVTVLWEPEA